MRCTQWVGLSSEADQFLAENVKMVGYNPYPHCGKNTGQERSISRNGRVAYGIFEEIPLRIFHLKDGRTAIEVVQASPWSSGPVIFTCLEIDGERIGEWDQEEIDRA